MNCYIRSLDPDIGRRLPHPLDVASVAAFFALPLFNEVWGFLFLRRKKKASAILLRPNREEVRESLSKDTRPSSLVSQKEEPNDPSHEIDQTLF